MKGIMRHTTDIRINMIFVICIMLIATADIRINMIFIICIMLTADAMHHMSC